MIVSLLLIQLVLCSVILYREVIKGQFQNFATSIFFIIYAIVYIVEPLVLHILFGGARSIMGGATELFRDPSVYLLFHSYSISLLLTAVILSSSQCIRLSSSHKSAILFNTVDITNQLAVIIIIGVLVFCYSTGMTFSDLLIASRFSWFDNGDFSLFWSAISSYLIALTGVFAYQIKLSKKRNYLLIILCICAIVLDGYITKDRKWVIFLASGWLAGIYEISGRKLQINKRTVVILAVLFIIMVASQFIRDVLFRYILGQSIDMADEFIRWRSFLIEYGDISYFYRASLEAIHQNLNNGFSIPLGIVRRILFFFLPTSYSGGIKVEDISAIFSDVVKGGDALRRGNMPPGLFGLFVISFGWFASLFLIPAMAILLRKLDLIFRDGHGILRNATLALYIFSIVMAFRGDESSFFYYTVSTILFLVAIKAIRSLINSDFSIIRR
jgi:hypothetical protein